MESTDTQLLDQHRRGEPDAFAQLVRRHINWVYSAARRKTADAHLAEDITQAVFIVLAQSPPTRLHSAALSPWLFGVLIRTCKTTLRAEAIRRRHESEAAKMRPTTTDPQADWNSIAPNLEDAVAKLRFVDQQAILLRFYEQLSFAEVGEMLGITEEAARKRVSRATEKLRSKVGADGSISVASVATLLLSHASIPAPSELLASAVSAAMSPLSLAVSATALAHAAGGFGATSLKGALLMTAMTKAKLGVLAAILMLAVAGGLVHVLVAPGKSRASSSGGIATLQAQPTWQEEMDKQYSLAPGENAKWIKPNQFSAARTQYGRHYYPAGDLPSTYSFKFLWDAPSGKIEFDGLSSAPMTLRGLLMSWGKAPAEIEMSAELAQVAIGGDWVLRVDPSNKPTPAAKDAVLEILNRELKRSIRVTPIEREREVLVVRGTMKPTLSGTDGVLLLGFAGEKSDFAPYRGTLQEAFNFLSTITNRKIIDESDAGNMSCTYSRSRSFDAARFESDAAALDSVLDNLSGQTGLEFRRERRIIEAWKIDEAQTKTDLSP